MRRLVLLCVLETCECRNACPVICEEDLLCSVKLIIYFLHSSIVSYRNYIQRDKMAYSSAGKAAAASVKVDISCQGRQS